jgi:hypothetical protein
LGGRNISAHIANLLLAAACPTRPQNRMRRDPNFPQT